MVVYTCVSLIGDFTVKMSQGGYPKVPAQVAVQVNIAGRDGSAEPPLFIQIRLDLFDPHAYATTPTPFVRNYKKH